MAPFDFKSDMHFIASSDKLTLHVYQLNMNANPSSIRKAHWSEVAIIVPGRDDNNNDYNGVVFFDGHGEMKEPVALTKLAQDLTRLRLMVSPEGYCYQDVTEFGELKDFGIQYLRLNDTFDWSHYGVDLATTSVWLRSKLRYHIPKHDKQTKQVGGGSVRKEKYEELKKLMKEKEEELEKVTEEKDDAEEELQRLKEEKQSEMEELKNEKDKELRKLKKERDRTVQKKEEELQRLRKENEELRKLTREKEDKNDDDDNAHDNGDTRRVQIKLIREEKDEELRKLRKEKDDEMAKLVKEKDEELRKARTKMEEEAQQEMDKLKKKKEEELQKLKSQSLKTEADLQQKLEFCIQRSWSISILPNRRNLPVESSYEETKQFLLTSRRPVPPETFEVLTTGAISDIHMRNNMPEMKEGSDRLLYTAYNIAVNEKDTAAWWPAPPKVRILTSDGKFDMKNWWFAKFFAPEGGLTMVAYYDGNFDSVTVSRTTVSQPTIPLPYSKHAAFSPYGRTFVVGSLPVGMRPEMRLAFVYRD